MKKIFLLLFAAFLLSPACTKGDDAMQTVKVTVINACTAENAAGDTPYDFCTEGYVGFRTDAGDRGAAKAVLAESGKIQLSAEVSASASELWCYSGGAIGTVQTFTVPSAVTFDAAGSSDGLDAMVFCSMGEDISSSGLSVEACPVTSAVMFEILDSKGEFTGKEVTSITIEADEGIDMAGDISLNFAKAGISSIANTSSAVTVTASNAVVGGSDIPLRVGAVLIPCEFTGKITVSGPDFTAATEIATPLHFVAGYVKTVPVDLATAEVTASPVLRIGVIGDSISSFEGMIPEGYRFYYPKSDCDVDTWQKTYWGVLITSYWKGELDMNCSYSGGCVAPCPAKALGSDFVSRVRDFVDPDIVLIHGGTNDCIASNGISQGSYDYDSPFGMLDTYCHFRESYIAVIRYIQEHHPDAKIIIVLGDHVTGDFAESVVEIAEHYALPLVDFRGDANVTKYSGSHPDAAGMAYMARKIYTETLDIID